jgi:hypothetical protein
MLKIVKSRHNLNYNTMNTILNKTVEFLTGAKVHANHNSIKGRKSSGKEDQSHHKNWKSVSGDID